MTADAKQTQLHASAVALGDRAVLITGESGSGKSTLALELIALGACLVADDRVDAMRTGDAITLTPPSTIAGLIEARGAGLIRMPWQSAPLALTVDLNHPYAERLPTMQNRDLLGISCPVIFGKDRHGLAAVIAAVLVHGVLNTD